MPCLGRMHHMQPRLSMHAAHNMHAHMAVSCMQCSESKEDHVCFLASVLFVSAVPCLALLIMLYFLCCALDTFLFTRCSVPRVLHWKGTELWDATKENCNENVIAQARRYCCQCISCCLVALTLGRQACVLYLPVHHVSSLFRSARSPCLCLPGGAATESRPPTTASKSA